MKKPKEFFEYLSTIKQGNIFNNFFIEFEKLNLPYKTDYHYLKYFLAYCYSLTTNISLEESLYSNEVQDLYNYFNDGKIPQHLVFNTSIYSFILENLLDYKISCCKILRSKDLPFLNRAITIEDFFLYNRNFEFKDFSFNSFLLSIENKQSYIKNTDNNDYCCVVFDLTLESIDKYFFDDRFYFYSSDKVQPLASFHLGKILKSKNDKDDFSIPFDVPFLRHRIIKYPIVNYINNLKLNIIKSNLKFNKDSLEKICHVKSESLIQLKGLELSDFIEYSNIINLCNKDTKEPLFFISVNEYYEKYGEFSVGIHNGEKWVNTDFRISRNRFSPIKKFDLNIIIKEKEAILVFDIPLEQNSFVIKSNKLKTKNLLLENDLYLGSANKNYRSSIMNIKKVNLIELKENIDSQLNPIIL